MKRGRPYPLYLNCMWRRWPSIGLQKITFSYTVNLLFKKQITHERSPGAVIGDDILLGLNALSLNHDVIKRHVLDQLGGCALHVPSIEQYIVCYFAPAVGVDRDVLVGHPINSPFSGLIALDRAKPEILFKRLANEPLAPVHPYILPSDIPEIGPFKTDDRHNRSFV